MIEQAAGDAAALGCLDEVLRCRAIVTDGTSADAQLAIYRQWRDKGAEREEAFAAVSEWLTETTLGRMVLAKGSWPAPLIACSHGHCFYPLRSAALHIPPPAETPAIHLDEI